MMEAVALPKLIIQFHVSELTNQCSHMATAFFTEQAGDAALVSATVYQFQQERFSNRRQLS